MDQTEAHLAVERVVAAVQLALVEMRVAVAGAGFCPVLVVVDQLVVLVRVVRVAPQVTLVEAVAEMQTAAVAAGEQMAERQHSHK